MYQFKLLLECFLGQFECKKTVRNDSICTMHLMLSTLYTL